MKKYTLFLFVFLLAYLFSEVLVRTVFVSYSPKIRPNLDKYIVHRISQLRDAIQRKETAVLSPQALEEYADYVAPGVKAAETEGTGFSEYEIDSIIWVKHTITLKNGEKVKVEVPKGQTPPDASMFEEQQETDSVREVQ